jgi:DNA-directed RNA polymerase alpha subunit
MAVVETTVYLPEELWQAAQMLAAYDGDVNTVIIRALEEYLTCSHRRRVGQRPGKYKKLVDSLSTPVSDLHLSARSATCLRSLNIRYVYELVEKAPTDLLRTQNFGQRSLHEIQEKLTAMGLTLGVKRDDTSYSEAIMATVVARIKGTKG